MHVRVSATAIFWETPLNWTTIGYYKLVECQRLYSFLHHLPRPVNMVENSIFPLWERSIFCNFQNASPRKCSRHFLRNSTPLKYYRVLQTGRVSGSVLIRWPLAMTCKHGRKSKFRKWVIFGTIFKLDVENLACQKGLFIETVHYKIVIQRFALGLRWRLFRFST